MPWLTYIISCPTLVCLGSHTQSVTLHWYALVHIHNQLPYIGMPWFTYTISCPTLVCLGSPTQSVVLHWYALVHTHNQFYICMPWFSYTTSCSILVRFGSHTIKCCSLMFCFTGSHCPALILVGSHSQLFYTDMPWFTHSQLFYTDMPWFTHSQLFYTDCFGSQTVIALH